MNEEELRAKVSKIRKGSKVSVLPKSMESGDPYNAIGIPCISPARSAVDLSQPFYAQLENFDGEVLWLRTQSFFCLKVSIGDIKEINVLMTMAWSSSKVTE